MEKLITNLQSTDEASRLYTAEDLGDLGGSEAAVPLVHRLPIEESLAVQNAIVASLQRVDTSQVHDNIFELFMSADAYLRNAAVTIFGKGGEDAVAYLTSKLDHSDREVRKLVLDAMFEIGSDETLLVLRAGLFDESLNVQITAVEYLGRLADSEAVEEMVALFKENDEPMLRAAILETMAMVADSKTITEIIAILIPDTSPASIDPVFLAPLIELTAKAGSRADIIRLVISVPDRNIYGEDISIMIRDSLKRFPDLLKENDILNLVFDIIGDSNTDGDARYQAVECLLLGQEDAGFSVNVLADLGNVMSEENDPAMALPAVRLLAAAGKLDKVRHIMENSTDQYLIELSGELLEI